MKMMRFFALGAILVLASSCQNFRLGHHKLKASDPGMRDISQESRPLMRAMQHNALYAKS